MQQDQFRTTVADTLLAAGLQPYQTQPAAPLVTGQGTTRPLTASISKPGWHVNYQTRRELMLEYRSDAPATPATVQAYLSRVYVVLYNAGIPVRRTADRSGVIATDSTEPATAAHTPAAPQPVDIEAYRLSLLVDLAVELSAGVGEHAARYEYLNAEGRDQFRRRVQTIRGAPVSQLHMWRQRGIGTSTDRGGQ